MVVIILTNSSKDWEIAVLYPFLTAVKYPFNTLEILIKGSPTAIRRSGLEDITDLSHILEIVLENIKTVKLHPKPKSSENNIQLFTAFKPLKKLLFANCSDTIQVQARPIPDVVIVTKNIYTDITKPKVPTASEPILLETYKLNIILILRMIIAVNVKIIPLIKNIFVLFKISPLNKYDDLIWISMF